MCSPSLSAAFDANLHVIRQAINLLPALGGERYRRKLPVCYHASIGAHLRHIIEHFQGFLDGLETDRIDYENRPRNREIEADPEAALDALAMVTERLGNLRTCSTNHTLGVAAETVPGFVTSSSVLRELEFLLSHTIHHYALIGTLARLQGFEPEITFGLAPSTLRYQEKEQTACAP